MEIQILKWFDAVFHSQTWLNYIMLGITYLGEFGAAAIVCAVLLLIFKKTRWTGVAVGVALLIDFLIVNVILKVAVDRPRPWTEWEDVKSFYESVGLRMPTDSSFPSGHTASMFAAAVVLVIRYRLKGLPALAVALLVALSRIYLCMHYPSDVLGGILIGSACGVAGHFAAVGIRKLFVNHISKAPKGGGEDGGDD